MLRPVPAQWFELLTTRQDLGEVMRVLADSGTVELEVGGAPANALLFPGLAAKLDEARDLSKRYVHYWPKPDPNCEHTKRSPLAACQEALSRLQAWQSRGETIIRELEARLEEQRDLDLLRDGLFQSSVALPDLDLIANRRFAGTSKAAERLVETRLYFTKSDISIESMPSLVLRKSWKSDRGSYLLLVGRPRDLKAPADQLRSLGAHLVPLPHWLPSRRSDAAGEIDERLAELNRRIGDDRREIAELNESLRVADALGVLQLIEWLSCHAGELQGTETLAWITGWTSEPDGKETRIRLEKAKVKYLFNIARPPHDADSPVILANPRWGRRFEVFTKLLGVPVQDSVDPSMIVGLIAPLLFGYMFGDVGQGAVILLVGLILGRRIEALKFLVPSGAMAILFGLLFGSIFGREDIIAALWFHPLSDPIKVLLFGLSIGIAILAVGLLLNALQAHWRSRALEWWVKDAGILVCYGGLILSYLDARALVIPAVGAAWFIVGGMGLAMWQRSNRFAEVFMEFAETLFQLLVNTVSFARVGAFALAHSGLSAAIVGVADAAGGVGYTIALILGNVLVVVLEGLIVGIQTTRLVLFEFFVRFFEGGGRAFHALPPPAADLTTTTTSKMRSANP